MKNLILLLLIIIFISCNEEELEFPSTFEVSINSVDLTSADISWSKLNSSDFLLYDILLSNSIVALEISDNSYSFTGLNIYKDYSGKVIAKNQNGQRSVGEFTFTTKGVDFQVELDKLVFDLDSEPTGVIASIKWNKAMGPNNLEPEYTVALNGTTIGSNITNNIFEIPNILSKSNSYRITVVAEIPNNRIIREINIHTPSNEDESELTFNMNPNYIGYTAFNVQFTSLNSEFTNSVYLNSQLLHSDYDKSDLLISDLPLNIVPNYSEQYKLEVISMKNDTLGSKSTLTIDPHEVRKLPSSDFFVTVYYIEDTVAYIYASNNSTIPEYDPGLNGNTRFKIYLNDEYISSTICDYFVGDYFPVLSILPAGSTNYVKFEVDYNNPPINPIYEPEIDLTIIKEVEFTTYNLPRTSELDIKIENITSNSFDLFWRTNLLGLYGCSPGAWIDQGFKLQIGGEEFTSFNVNQNPVNINGLAPNTEYSAKLIFFYRFAGGSRIERTSEFEIITIE